MSLLENAFEDFVVMNKAVVDDGYGGTTTTWSFGVTIKGAMMFDNSAQMRIAQALGSTSTYTFTVKRNVVLDFHTVLQRASDGKFFRLTSNSDDKKTPASAGLE